jgi:hypothetical protein
MKGLSRRQFFDLSGRAMLGAWASSLITRRARATPASSATRRLVILHAGGGMRSTALFNADVTPQWNPFGRVTHADLDATGAPLVPSGVAWGVGAPLAGNRHPLTLASWGGLTLPLVTQLADQITVLGAVDHDPSADSGDANHYSATTRMCTGAPDSQIGLLTRISRALGQNTGLPPVVVGGSGPIGASVYGIGTGEYARFRPIVIGGVTDFRYPRRSGGAADPAGTAALESRLDAAMAQARPQALDGRITDVPAIKQLSLRYGGVLATDALRIPYVPAAALGTTTSGAPLTNAMLTEAFGVPGGAAQAGLVTDPFYGGPTALAVRLLQLGAPVVAVGSASWDFHSNEDTGLPPLAASLGRAISALRLVLGRLADPAAPGRTFWDSALLVVTSEFGRDNTADTDGGGLQVGFNRGDGSDHHGTNACRYQALPILGGGIPGGRLLAGTDDKVSPMAQPIPSQSLLATLLFAVGIDPKPHFAAPPLPEIFG